MHPNAIVKAMFNASDDADQTQTHSFMLRNEKMTFFRAEFITFDFPFASDFSMIQYWLIVNTENGG